MIRQVKDKTGKKKEKGQLVLDLKIFNIPSISFWNIVDCLNIVRKSILKRGEI